MRHPWICVLLTLSSCVVLVAQAPGGPAKDLALTNAKIYTAPDVAPIANGVVLVRGDLIVTAGPVGSVKLPPGTQVLDCAGLTITAGFQNSHVHFMEGKWNDPLKLPAAMLTNHLSQMLTAYGFTTVVDTGSDLAVTTAVRS
jgi:predicted amidohydrolase YtcJ